MSLIDELKQQASKEAGWVLAHDLFISDANFTILEAKYNPQGKFGPKWDLSIKVEAVFQDVELPLPESGKCSFSLASNPTRDAFFKLLQPHLPVYNMSVDETPSEGGKNPYNDLVEIKPDDDRYLAPPKAIARTNPRARISQPSSAVPRPPTRRPITTTATIQHEEVKASHGSKRASQPVVEEIDPFAPDFEFDDLDQDE